MTDAARNTPGTSHVYGCCHAGCTAFATTKVETWQPGWGWINDGDYCQEHASEKAVRLVDFDTRKVPIHAG